MCKLFLDIFLLFSPNKNSHKRILLFTNNDNPNSSDPSQQVSRVCQYNLIIMELTSLAHCYTQFIFPLYIISPLPLPFCKHTCHSVPSKCPLPHAPAFRGVNVADCIQILLYAIYVPGKRLCGSKSRSCV